MHKNQQKETLKTLMKRKQSKSFYAQRMGVSVEIVTELMNELRGLKNDYAEAINYIADLESHVEVSNDKGTLKSTVVSDFEPKTNEQLIELHRIDTTKYKISSYWSKLKSNGKFTSSVFCTLRKPEDISLEDLQKVLENYKTPYKPLTKLNILLNDTYADPCSAFLDLTDFHLDKKVLGGETTEEKVKIFYSIVDKLLYKAYKAHKLEEIVFVIGSDWFHADTFQGETTNKTNVMPSMSFDQSFELGFEIYETVINKLKQFCERLKVILVQGNHDRTKSFYLAHGLSKYFSNEPNIIFDIEAKNRKIHIYGTNFIGLHHGNCKIDDLPLIFAQEFSEQWGPCKFKEIKVGDKHFYMEKEIRGIRIKQLPSLSGTDQWHDDNNFIQSLRAGIISIYHPTKGRVSEFEERI